MLDKHSITISLILDFVFLLSSFYFFIYVMFVGMHTHVCVPAETEKGIRSSEAGVTGNCELLGVDAGPTPGYSGRAVSILNLKAISPGPSFEL